MIARTSIWRKRWWTNYYISLGNVPNYLEGDIWRDWINDDLKKWNGILLKNNIVEFDSQLNLNRFVLKWGGNVP